MKQEQKEGKELLPDKKKFLKNGLVLDSIGEGGIVEYVSSEDLRFWRDIGPHFMSTYTLIFMHLFFYFTGNLGVPLFFSLCRVFYHIIAGNEKQVHKRNVARKTEKLFMEDKRFAIPMATCQLMGLFTWIWCLCLFSDDVKFNLNYFSNYRPTTWPQLLMFFFCLGFMSSIETSCAHELIHRREWYNKYLGMFSFSKIFYLHFRDVHVQSHHK